MASNTLGLAIRLLSEPPDLSVLAEPQAWDLLKEHSKHLGVAQLVAYIARSHVPRPEREWCDKVLTHSWVRHERSLNQLQYVLSVLNDAGVETISLKGPLLARRCYDPPFLRRPSADLDIAIRQRDLQRACEALGRCGYQYEGSFKEDLACSHHLELTHLTRHAVELHFRLSHGGLGIPVDDALFDRSIDCPLPGGGTARIPGPVDELLQLVLHLAKDRFKPIFHLYEIRRLWRAAPAAVREEVVSRAADHHFRGVLRMMDIAFRERWGEAFLPPECGKTKTWLDWRLGKKLYASVEDWTKPEQDLTLQDRLRGRWLELQSTDRPSDALRLLGMMARITWFQTRRRGWRPIRRRAPVAAH